MVINQEYLLKRNARDKIQVVYLEFEQIGNDFIIKRYTGQYDGKKHKQPDIYIKSNSKKSIFYKAKYEYNQLLKKYLKDEYVTLQSVTNKKYNLLTKEEMEQLVPSLTTNKNGFIKPMLIKDFNECSVNVLDKNLYCRPYINGIRCIIFFYNDEIIALDDNGNRVTFINNILNELSSSLQLHQDLVLDCEIDTRKIINNEPQCLICDVIKTDKTFLERLEILNNLNNNYKSIKIAQYTQTNNYTQIEKLTYNYIINGFSGLIAVNPHSLYKPGRKSKNLISFTMGYNEKFIIKDIVETPLEKDMYLILETKDGRTFNINPKENYDYYLNNKNILMGKYCQLRFFSWDTVGIPKQPILQTIFI